MYNPDTDLLFPLRLLPQLRDLRGPAWTDLLDKVAQEDGLAPERVTFVLLMARLHGCANCQADSYRAMQGCTQCSVQTIKRLRLTDEELASQYDETLQEVSRYLGK